MEPRQFTLLQLKVFKYGAQMINHNSHYGMSLQVMLRFLSGCYIILLRLEWSRTTMEPRPSTTQQIMDS